MNGEHAEFELLDGYALGTLTKADAGRVRAHVASCERCRAELGELQSVADVIPFTLSEPAPPARLRERILAQIDEPAQQPRSKISPLVAGLAAALALAVGADVWLATLLRSRPAPTVAVTAPAVAVVTTPTPAVATTPTVRSATASPTGTRQPATTLIPATQPSSAPKPRSSPSAQASPNSASDRSAVAILRGRVAKLEAALADLRRSASERDTSEVARIVGLQSELAAARRTIVAEATAPKNAATPNSESSTAPESALVAELSTGHVYSVDGSIGTQAWHLTIVQPLAGKNALIYTRTPSAPSGDTYRTWVVRDGKTYDAGALPPDSVTKLEMPMPLENGDVVAFSREPLGTGSLPTTPFLMQITIHT
jgi:hypothetical protein